MHVLFVHQNFPAQFGHIAKYLTGERGHQCTFVSQTPPGTVDGIRKIQYEPVGKVPERTIYFARDFEGEVRDAAGVYEALKPLRSSIRPDLIVGHASLGSTVFLHELYPGTPVIGYFEYFYRSRNAAIDYRPEWPIPERKFLRARTQNAMIMLELEYCTAGYTPTRFQHELFPEAYRGKIRVIHDGIDTMFWRRIAEPPRGDEETRVVTYVARGFESMRGFDIFLRVAKRIYERYPNVVFLVVGGDSVEYGSDLEQIAERSFKEHVLKQDDYDLDRIRFLGRIPPEALVQVLNLSDLHIYLTVPFVVSWSLLDAMACGCTVLASDTAPVKEVVRQGENGLLREFFDVDGLADTAVEVLKDPEAYTDLGRAAENTIRERYSLEAVMPGMVSFYEEVAATSEG
jgi:glycosyltransferase involved in cell wall biosynthesis